MNVWPPLCVRKCSLVTKLLRATFATLILAVGVRPASGQDAPVEYNRDIRPILFENCLSCHGPDSASREADLRLDQLESAEAIGAIVPGDPDSSEMIRRILSDDEAEQMPPPETKKSLTDEQKQLLGRWIRQGAKYEPHWSLIPPARPALPKVGNSWWTRNPIDRFVAARLEAEGLDAAPEADRRTLARRLSLDLTGLPPEPELVEEFVNDRSSDAYEKLVDKLLESTQWGEHRARYWLDAARYADTHGIHFDNYREMWSYRDWVINAFNANMPFDQFTIENLAGDLIPNATLDQKIASGFNRCNITTNEGGVIPEEYAVLYARDRTETTSMVWMGLTAGCAVCHDHKFDPLSQHEFYQLAAFFNNTTQNPMDGNIKDTPPVVVVPVEDDRKRWDELAGQIESANKLRDARRLDARPEFETWLASAKPEDVAAQIPTSDLELYVPLDDGGPTVRYELRGKPAEATLPGTVEWRPGKLGANAAYLNQGEILKVANAGNFDTGEPFSYAAWVKLPANDGSGALFARMNDKRRFTGWDLWVEGRRIGGHLIYRWPEYAIKVVTRDQLPADEWVHVAVSYDGKSKAAGFKVYVNGELQPTNVLNDSLAGSIRTKVPFKIGQRDKGAPLSGASLQDIRIYARALAAGEIVSLAKLGFSAVVAAAPEKRSQADVDALYEWWLMSLDDAFQTHSRNHEAFLREQGEIQARATIAHVMQEKGEAASAYVLNRGEYDQRRDKVAPGTPKMLPPFPAEAPRDRLGFAHWLLLPEHPLTARVTVNRFWNELFGAGLVRTAGDFGISGELPSHPELLDWLAVEFRESGWDVKQFYKLIVMSATYRQSAATTPEKLDKDPDNRLLARGPRFRMDAEMVRDYALAASSLLSEKIGGPSVKPYQPPGVWEAVAMIGSNTRNYQQDSGEALYRRSLYTFWKRSAPPASMDVFNAPNREHCVVVRERTNTPLQALVTLNDPQLVEAARTLAELALQAESGQQGRIDFMAQRLLARRLTSQETAILQASLEKFQSYYSAHPDDSKKLIEVGESEIEATLPPAELATWTMVANQLMNLDEVLNK
jgi:mono/diheme cytochrome c family protein